MIADSEAREPAVVLDSWILLCWMKDQRPASEVMEKLWQKASKGQIRLVINIVNLGEVFYVIAKDRNLETAEVALDQLSSMPLDIHPASNSLVLEAARLKGQFPISYADAFAAVTAVREKAPLVTGDPEMKVLENRGIISIQWVERR